MDTFKTGSKTNRVYSSKLKINLFPKLKPIDYKYYNTNKKLKNSNSSSCNKTNKNLYFSKSKNKRFKPLSLYQYLTIPKNDSISNERKKPRTKKFFFQNNHKADLSPKNNLECSFEIKNNIDFFDEKTAKTINKKDEETNTSFTEISSRCLKKEKRKMAIDGKKSLNLKNERKNKISKILDLKELESQIKENNKKIKKINSGYFFKRNKSIKNKLSIFSKEIYNTQANSNISPFSLNPKKEFLYKEIFCKDKNKMKANDNSSIENRLNLIYAENEKQYMDIIKKSEIKVKKGKKTINLKLLNSINIELSQLSNKSNFIKKVIDFTFPEMVVGRIREENKILKTYRNKNMKTIDCKYVKNVKDIKEKIYTDYLLESLTVKKREFK